MYEPMNINIKVETFPKTTIGQDRGRERESERKKNEPLYMHTQVLNADPSPIFNGWAAMGTQYIV